MIGYTMVFKNQTRIPRREGPVELIEYSNPICPDGYHVDETPVSSTMKLLLGEQRLIDEDVALNSSGILTPNSRNVVFSRTVEEPGLFRIFAELDTTDEILAFAGSYGLLYGVVLDGEWKLDAFEDGIIYQGFEAVNSWRSSISKVASSVRLLDGFRGKADLSTHFRIDSRRGGKRVAFYSHPEFQQETIEGGLTGIERDPHNPPRFYQRDLGSASDVVMAYERRDFRRLAQHVLRAVVNENLSKVSGDWRGDWPAIYPALQTDAGEFALRLIPCTMHDLIWLQVAQAATNRSEYRKCTICPRWFAVVQFGRRHRSDRIYCSPACKIRAHRAKHQKEKGEQS